MSSALPKSNPLDPPTTVFSPAPGPTALFPVRCFCPRNLSLSLVMRRRSFLQLAAISTALGPLRLFAEPATLEPWRPGTLDIHHLAYGRGNSTFILCPDGTTLLIDAGTNNDSLEVSCTQKPNANLRPGEWIATYILRQMQPAGRRELDFALITHIHPDHLGDLGPDDPPSSKGNYHLTGIMDVDARVPIGILIDRGFPDYRYPLPQQAPFALNYIEFVHSRQKLGESTERARAGSASQIRLLRLPNLYPDFSLLNLAANGEVWTGNGDQTRSLFPDLKNLPPSDYPTENMCSIAIRLAYGNFRYFTGGDLTADTEDSGESWRDIETPVARAASPVDVAVADHHAYFDAVGADFVRALRPRVFVIPSWYVAHPAALPLRRMLSHQLYPGDRDVYATCVMAPNQVVNNQFIGKLASLEGHIIVRVSPPGDEFRVIVTDNNDNTDRVKAIGGPWPCRASLAGRS
jgi:beta-lactamase superfamily II metal-dependent hydrolase